MGQHLLKLPYEVLSNITEYLSLEDIENLAITCSGLLFLWNSDDIARKALLSNLPHSEEFFDARKQGGGFAQALRRMRKRHEAWASARPFFAAIVGVCDDYLYCSGVLSYLLDDTLRVLDLHKCARREVVVNLPKLVRELLADVREDTSGLFRLLYYSEGLLSCLYTLSPSTSPVVYLIVLDLCLGSLVLCYRIRSTDNVIVRHNSNYLYYGVHPSDTHDRHRKWVFRGYDFEKRKWFDNIYLSGLIGADVGTNVCFEIIGDHFYALSNQTTSDVEEVDWSSFYHVLRFPLDSPCMESMEKTLENEHSWRRQHREGPIDDRWLRLALYRDPGTGDVLISETRKEFRHGATRGRRTCYTTKVVFPDPDLLPDATMSRARSDLFSTRRIERQEWAARTNDRLALTLTDSDHPHWCPEQPRLPQNVHPSLDGSFVLAQTPLRDYIPAAQTFIDLVDDRDSKEPAKQRLRIRVSSRQLDQPLKANFWPDTRVYNGLEVSDDFDGQSLKRYQLREPAYWPPNYDGCGPSHEAHEELFALLNPPEHEGNVKGTADATTLVYTTGGSRPNQLKSLVFLSFDPAIHLPGFKTWGSLGSSPYGIGNATGQCGGSTVSRAAIISLKREHGSLIPAEEWDGADVKRSKKAKNGADSTTNRRKSGSESISRDLGSCVGYSASWLRTEPAMYEKIQRGYDFGWAATT